LKNILIAPRLQETAEYSEVREALDLKWGKLFKELNFLPVVASTEIEPSAYFDHFSIDGVVLSGGNDLSTHKDGELSRKRDAHEQELVKVALQNKTPILGVCRGMQFLTEFFGGKLKKIDDHLARRHKIEKKNHSRYITIASYKTVNSFHAYSPEVLPENFIRTSCSQDGQVESIEHEKEDILAVMWHPERENPFLKADLDFMKVLFNA